MKKTLAALLSVLTAVIMPLTTCAAATRESAPTTWCNVTFIITDESGGYPGDSITAIMTDTANSITDTYTFTTANSWGHGRTPKYSMTAPATYTVTFEELEDGYAIVNTLDRSNEIIIEAAAGGIADCLWSIVATGDEEAVTTSDNAGTGSEILQQTGSGNREISNEDAEEVYQSFLNTVSYIKDDENWYNALLIQYDWFGESYAEWYADYVEGGTEEDFLAMSLFDQFVWSETYLRYAWAVSTGSISTYYGSEEDYKTHITRHVTNLIESAPDYEAVEEAYLTLAQWQYDYVQENGYPYNFINGRTYLEETGGMPEITTPEEAAAQEQRDLEEAAAELLAELDDDDIQELMDETENSSSGSTGVMGVIIAVIVVILLAAGGAFVFLNRRKE